MVTITEGNKTITLMNVSMEDLIDYAQIGAQRMETRYSNRMLKAFEEKNLKEAKIWETYKEDAGVDAEELETWSKWIKNEKLRLEV